MAKNQGKKAINIVSKLSLGITIGFMAIAVTTAAIIGAVSGIAISSIIASYFPNLLPMIAGGIIGLGISPLYWTVFTGPLVVLFSPIQFGIGVGLTALGLTSPAAIGALSAGLTTAIPFLFMLAGIGIWSDMMSSFMNLAEEKFPQQPSSKFDEGVEAQNFISNTLFNRGIGTQDSDFRDQHNFSSSRLGDMFDRVADNRNFGCTNLIFRT